MNDPVGFSAEVLGVDLVPLQRRALESLLIPPYCTLCPSANEQGKTLGAACAVLWWYCTRSPAIVPTTAPTKRQVEDLLWKEIRRLARISKIPLNLPFFPRAARIERAADDFAYGFTARDSTSAQGQHGPNILLVIDEATGVDPEIWQSFESQFSPPGHAWLVLYNPTDSGSRVFLEQTGSERHNDRLGARSWHVVRMSALDHPNIAAELAGGEPVVPYAMRLAKFDRLFRKWSQLVGCPVGGELQRPTDIVWPPVESVKYCEATSQIPRVWRPGPLAESRLLGRFSRQGTNSVWSDGDWIAAVREGLPLLPIPLHVPEIGCDVANQGEDYTSIAVRMGPKLLFFHEVNGQNTVETAEKIKELCATYSMYHNQCLSEVPSAAERSLFVPISPKQVPIKVDDGPLGGVGDQLRAAGYLAQSVMAQSKAYMQDDYPNRRSELWFACAELAREDRLDLSGLIVHDGELVRVVEEDVIDELRRQMMAVTWSIDSHGRPVVAPKDEMKKVLGRSPDGADAINLAYSWVGEQHLDADPFPIAGKQNPLLDYRRK